ncbi:MAG TPA: hypothetical protein VFY10_10985 [Dehalococcoidia bacterium]|nr:hypothetical protein [Dehalococcoidia bacterium]
MEILVIIVAFWLMLVGIYGGLSLMNSSKRRRDRTHHSTTVRSTAVAARSVSKEQPVLGGLFSEVDMLRVQVEDLRSQVVALSGTGRPERSRQRRYSTGVYTDLPRMLRRHVKEVRDIRHPLHV